MNSTPSACRALLAVAVALALGAACPAPAQMSMPTQTRLRVGPQLIQAEVASTEQQRETGLMFRHELPGGRGMLFVFGSTQPVCMWMKNTLIPLSVAFIDSHGRIVNVADMQPQTLDPHCAVRNVAFALEMPLGWFDAHAVHPGDQFHGFPFGDAAQH
jgi:uncharacterized membrane protein (UPF0127 family)